MAEASRLLTQPRLHHSQALGTCSGFGSLGFEVGGVGFGETIGRCGMWESSSPTATASPSNARYRPAASRVLGVCSGVFGVQGVTSS